MRPGRTIWRLFWFFIKNGYGALRGRGRHLGVSKPSVCHAVAVLQEGAFLIMDEDHFLHLTEQGRKIAEKNLRAASFFTAWLMEAGVDLKSAEKVCLPY